LCIYLFIVALVRNIRDQEIFNLLLPPVVPVIRFFLSTTGVLSTVFAKSAQVLGFWRTDKNGVEDLLPEQRIPPSVSEGLVDSEVKNIGDKVKDDVKKAVPQHVGPAQKEDKIFKEGRRTQRLVPKESAARKDQLPKGNSQHPHSGKAV
jgi:hypothetical protein